MKGSEDHPRKLENSSKHSCTTKGKLNILEQKCHSPLRYYSTLWGAIVLLYLTVYNSVSKDRHQ